MYQAERAAVIMKELEKAHRVDVNKLSELTGSSRETIRRDLHELEREGMLLRVYGGAVAASENEQNQEYPAHFRKIQNAEAKRSICKEAIRFVHDGDVIFLDNSTTVSYLVDEFPEDYHLTVLTNALQILLKGRERGCVNHTYICLGGYLNPRNASLYGQITRDVAQLYYPNSCFLSCRSVRMQDRALLDGSLLEVETKQKMIELASSVYLLADNSKWETGGHVYLASFDKINMVITDRIPSNGSGFESDRVIQLQNDGLNAQ